jgi:chemotaxis protein methyltransferase CheR
LRDRALAMFAEALCPRGFLCLGSKESLRFSGLAQRFTEQCSAERIYRRAD